MQLHLITVAMTAKRGTNGPGKEDTRRQSSVSRMAACPKTRLLLWHAQSTFMTMAAWATMVCIDIITASTSASEQRHTSQCQNAMANERL
eukprot:353972-Chlamydomonas_euryale.AAC.11